MPHCHTLTEQLRQRGYRITPQRAVIIETIAHRGHHLTAEAIVEAVRPSMRALNIATVYRTLDLLTREGIISRLDLGSGGTVFATRAHGPHAHVYCRQCGIVIEIAHDALAHMYAQLRRYVQERQGFLLELHHVALPGLCPQCQQHEMLGTRTKGVSSSG